MLSGARPCPLVSINLRENGDTLTEKTKHQIWLIFSRFAGIYFPLDKNFTLIGVLGSSPMN
jgi:hypothetical protein